MSEISKQENESLLELSEKISKHLNSPKVSIIVPVYNVEPYIVECLNSLVNQTLKELEFVCIDDGSDDNSLKILQEYAKNDNRFVILTQNREGQGVGRNKCIEIAKGEYIAFVDPDDKVELDMMEELYNYAKSNNAQVVQFNYTRFGESIAPKLNDFVKRYRKAFGINLLQNNIFNWRDIKKENMLQKVDAHATTRFYQTSFVKENQLKFAPTTIGEDQLFAIGILFKATQIHFLNKSFYHYRLRKGSAVNTKSDKSFCVFTNLDLAEQFFKNENLLPELDLILRHYKLDKLHWHYTLTSDDKISQYLEQIKKYLSLADYKSFEKLLKRNNKSIFKNLFSMENKYAEGTKFKSITILGFNFKILLNKKGEV